MSFSRSFQDGLYIAMTRKLIGSITSQSVYQRLQNIFQDAKISRSEIAKKYAVELLNILEDIIKKAPASAREAVLLQCYEYLAQPDSALANLKHFSLQMKDIKPETLAQLPEAKQELSVRSAAMKAAGIRELKLYMVAPYADLENLSIKEYKTMMQRKYDELVECIEPENKAQFKKNYERIVHLIETLLEFPKTHTKALGVIAMLEVLGKDTFRHFNAMLNTPSSFFGSEKIIEDASNEIIKIRQDAYREYSEGNSFLKSFYKNIRGPDSQLTADLDALMRENNISMTEENSSSIYSIK